MPATYMQTDDNFTVTEMCLSSLNIEIIQLWLIILSQTSESSINYESHHSKIRSLGLSYVLSYFSFIFCQREICWNLIGHMCFSYYFGHCLKLENKRQSPNLTIKCNHVHHKKRFILGLDGLLWCLFEPDCRDRSRQ